MNNPPSFALPRLAGLRSSKATSPESYATVYVVAALGGFHRKEGAQPR